MTENNRIAYEWNVLRTAFMFYSRMPVGRIGNYSSDMLNQATRYFPLVGVFVGSLGALVFWGVSQVLPDPIAILLSMIATIFFTGAFHEDGFADFCDGFGGGYTPERILDIMKDSRNGTYATVGVVLMLGMKFLALFYVKNLDLVLVLVAGHALSRFFPVLMIYSSKYVRLDELSKAKPIGKRGSWLSFVIAALFSFAPLAFLDLKVVGLATLLMFLTFLFFRSYVQRKLGGYTGDVLGALQQLCEVVFYLSCCVLFA